MHDSIHPGTEVPKIQLGMDEPRQAGLRCGRCGSRHPVYFISFPIGFDTFPPGAYCYPCLIRRCRQSRMIPFPIDQVLLDKIKLDMGLSVNTPPKHIIKR